MSAATGRHERTDASPRLVGLIAASVAVGVAAALLAAWGIFTAGSHTGAAELGPDGRFAHGPQERTPIEEEWPVIAAETRAHLAGYAWVDRPAGIVRLPIEQAMARLAATQPAVTPAAATPGAR